jgi:DNA-binding CsgD family transcriptional regulator
MTSSPAGRVSVPMGAAVPSLVRWGLSPDADLVFRTITTFGPRSAPTLAADLGMPLHRVDDALAELLAAGAAISATDHRRLPREAALWTTRPPAEVVTLLRSRRMRLVDPRAQQQAHHRAVTSLPDRPGRSPSLLSGPAPVAGTQRPGVRYLASREVARERLAELVAVERQERLVINTEQAFDADSARAAVPLDRALLERGVRVRLIGLPPADQDLHVGVAHKHPLSAYREKVELPLKLMVIDHRIALFPADPADLARGYLEVSQPGAVRALITLFEHHWAEAIDPQEHGMPEIVLQDRERELISLLAAGHTDVTAAEHLRISARSVTNILRGLMDRLGVDNRFQLGLALGAARIAQPSVSSSGEQPKITGTKES